MSTAGGLAKALYRAAEGRHQAIQIFTTSSRQWAPIRRDPGETAEFAAEVRRLRLPVLAHASYLVNLSAPDGSVERAREALVAELERCAALGVQWLVVHPGAHVGAGSEAGLERAAQSLRWALRQAKGARVRLLLELTAGQGTCLGGRLEELAWLLAATGSRRVGVCVDTCHAFAAGYDLRGPGGYAAFFTAFDALIGLHRLEAFHLNDSAAPLGSHVDRHAAVGRGHLGTAPFRRLVRDHRFTAHPAVVELPPDGASSSLALLRRWGRS